MISCGSSDGLTLSFVSFGNRGDAAFNFTLHTLNNFQAGDYCMFYDFASAVAGNPTPTLVVPAGFTQIATWTGSGDAPVENMRVVLSHKIMTGSEASVTGMNDIRMKKQVVILRPSRRLLALPTVTPVTAYVAGGDPPIQTVNASAVAAIASLVWAFVAGSTGVTYPLTFNPAADKISAAEGGDGSGGFADQRCGYKVYPTGTVPVSTTIDTNDQGDQNTLVSGYAVFT